VHTGQPADCDLMLQMGETAFGQSSFATHCIAPARNAIKVADDVPIELLGPFGCGFQTGAGTVLNALQVQEGEDVLVMGAGPAGLAAVMAAKIARAGTIAVLDREPARVALARELGATHEVVVNERRVTGGPSAGFDYCIDTTGNLALVSAAIGALSNRGQCALIAAYPPGARLEVDASFLMSGGRVVRGVVEGSFDQVGFIPRLIEYWRAGVFPVEKLISFYPFEQIKQAIADSEAGRAVKAVIRF
jgi:aryl-alcohol dehydrogenase